MERSIATHAEKWGATVASVLDTPFPWQAQHMSASADDCDVTPWVLHPCFHASLDWHSSCHMQASGIRLLGTGHLSDATSAAIVGQLDERLTADNARVEATYLREHPGYERPYGWAWATKLAVAAQTSNHPNAPVWAQAANIVVDAVADNLTAWLPKLAYPVRTGQHDNTAYGLLLAREGFAALGRDHVVAVIDEHAKRMFADDIDYPSRYEPGGNDFLSAALAEALLMKAVLAAGEFSDWLAAFLPNLGAGNDRLLAVPEVLDRTDGKLVHLFGLALFRAEALATLAHDVRDAERGEAMRTSAAAQFDYALDQINNGHFMATHWLVSFALRAADALAERR